MRMPRSRGWGARANSAVSGLASGVDAETHAVAERAAPVLRIAVGLLRWPTLALLILPAPFVLGLLAIAVFDSGVVRWIALGVGLALLVIEVLFGVRRAAVLNAVAEPEPLATELGIAVSLSGKVDETRGVLKQIAGGGKAGLFTRLRGLWRGVSMTDGWIESIGDLPRARYFFPPKLGTTITLAIFAAWAVPISFAAFIVMAIAALAH